MSAIPPRSWAMHGKPLGLVDAVPPDQERAEGSASLTGCSEPRLVELALRGDRAAWGELIARHDRRVVLALVARGLGLGDAREHAQQAWARLIAQQRAGRLARLELPGLVIRQAAFLALDAARRDRSGQGDAGELDTVTDPTASIEESLIWREQLQRVRAELVRCPPHARRVIELLYANPDMRHAEAARRLGLSVQRVRQTLCEVRARLRAALETESSDD
jgi:RNA polymerase sigma factor (sigma-70 family)